MTNSKPRGHDAAAADGDAVSAGRIARLLASLASSRFAAPISFFGLSLLFFWRLWARIPADRMMIGAADGDFMRQFYAYRAFVARAWGAGKPPLWNPHQYAGTPAWADPQLAVLYPWRWLQVPFSWVGDALPVWTVELEAVAHVALGGFFTFLLLRRLGAAKPAAYFSGLAFGFGGYLTGYPVEQLAVLDTAVWIPALLWALTGWLDGLGSGERENVRPPENSLGTADRIEADPTEAGQPEAGRAPSADADDRGWGGLLNRRFLIASATMALAVSAGHPQTALYALWAGIFWLIFRGRCAGLVPIRHAYALFAWLGASALFSAAQWLPTASFLRRSARDIDPAEIAAGLPVGDWIQVVAPGVISQWSPLFVGVITLVLALWGLARVPESRTWSLLALGAWTISLGGNNPLFPLYRILLPGMTLFRHQERIAVLVDLGLAVAAGLALSRLLEAQASGNPATVAGKADPQSVSALERSAARWLGMAAGLLLFIGAAYALRFEGQAYSAPDYCAPVGVEQQVASHQDSVAAGMSSPLLFSALVLFLAFVLLWMRSRGSLSRSGLAGGLLLLCLFELFSINRGAALCPRMLDPMPDARLEALLPKARDGRVSSEAKLPFGPNAASVFGLYDVTGDSPLQLGNVAALIDRAPEILWWRILNVRYALSDRPPEGAPLELMVGATDVGSPEGGSPAEAALYAVQLPVPPAWIPERLRCDPPSTPPEGRDVLTILEREGATLNPLEWLVLDEQAQAIFCQDGLSNEATTGEAPTLSGLDPGMIKVDATLPQEGWVVLSTAYEPGWRVRAESSDGQVLRPAVYQAYGAIMALRLPAGEWQLRWTYLPLDVIMGLALSLFGLLAGALLWRRSPSPRPRP